jgi:hypothetical protein
MNIFNGKEYDNFHDMKFYVERRPAQDGYALHLLSGHNSETLMRITAVSFEVSEISLAVDPKFFADPITLSREEAHRLMDELWGAGVRPSSGEGHTAHIQSLNSHLRDLRVLLFNKEGIKDG